MERMHLMMLQNAMSVAKICAIRSTLHRIGTNVVYVSSGSTAVDIIIPLPVSFFHGFSFSLGTETTNPRVQRAARNRQLPMTNWKMNLFLLTWRGKQPHLQTPTTLRHTDVALVWSRCGSLWKLIRSYKLGRFLCSYKGTLQLRETLGETTLAAALSETIHESSRKFAVYHHSVYVIVFLDNTVIPMKNHVWGFP